MSKDSDREPKTPIPITVGKSHAKRLDDLEDRADKLEEGQGKLMGEIGRLTELEDQRSSDRPSQAEFSLRPGGARAKFKNTRPAVVITAFITIVVMFILLALIAKLVFT